MHSVSLSLSGYPTIRIKINKPQKSLLTLKRLIYYQVVSDIYYCANTFW